MSIETIGSVLVAILGGITAILTAATPGYLAWRKSKENSKAIQDLHVIVNDRLTQLLAATGDAREAKGKNEERAAIQKENDAAIIHAQIAAKEILAEASRVAEQMLTKALAAADARLVAAAKMAETVLIKDAAIAKVKTIEESQSKSEPRPPSS